MFQRLSLHLLIKFFHPICFLIAVCLQFDCVSLLNILVLFLTPHVHVTSNSRTQIGISLLAYCRFSLFLTTFICVCDILFQIVVLSLSPQHLFYPLCSFEEIALRSVGFVQLQGATASTCVHHGLSRLLPFLISLLAFRFRHVRCLEEKRDENTYSHTYTFAYFFGIACLFASLTLATVLLPSLVSLLYLLSIYLLLFSVGFMYPFLRVFAVYFRALTFLCVAHVVVLYSYQLQLVQFLLDERSLPARLMGLFSVQTFNCLADPREFHLVEDLSWNYYVYPFVLYLLYSVIIFTKKIVLKYQYMSHRNTYNNHAVINMEPSNTEHVNSEKSKLLVYYDTICTSLNTIFLYVCSNIFLYSYLFSYIIMMYWSIRYHSWLTFVFLLWGLVVVVFRTQQRRWLLFSAPFLLVYGQFIVLLQFVYALSLTERELPYYIDVVDGLEFAEFIYRPQQDVWFALALQIGFLSVFSITYRQMIHERRLAGNTSDNSSTEYLRGSTFVWLRSCFIAFFVRVWLIFLAFLLCFFGFGGSNYFTDVNIIQVVYMFFFLVFAILFLVSFHLWRRLVFAFITTVISFQVFVLLVVYLYQFSTVRQALIRVGIKENWHHTFGLQVYETTSLFINLLFPTIFLVFCNIYLQYIHRPFLQISDIYAISRNVSLQQGDAEMSDVAASHSKTETLSKYLVLWIFSEKLICLPNTDSSKTSIDEQATFKQMRDIMTNRLIVLWNISLTMVDHVTWFVLRMLEIHGPKFAVLLVSILSVNDICVGHFLLICFVCVATKHSKAMPQTLFVSLALVWLGAMFLARLVYQLPIIQLYDAPTNCSDITDVVTAGLANISRQELNASSESLRQNDLQHNEVFRFINFILEWVGIRKHSNIFSYLLPYLVVIVLITFYKLVNLHALFEKIESGTELPPGVVFLNVGREQSDVNFLSMLKYLTNFCFYKFGVEICLIALVIVISTRLDIIALVYCFWLILLYPLSRHTQRRVWPYFVSFVTVSMVWQYVICLGLPSFLCIDYPFNCISELFRLWLFLPSYTLPPRSTLIIGDIILLILICSQRDVFLLETTDKSYPGGSNNPLTEHVVRSVGYVNKVSDYFTNNCSLLDLFKCSLSYASFWVCLALIFMAAVNDVTLLSFIYLIVAFWFLWTGNDFFMLNLSVIRRRWLLLIGFNVLVIGLKSGPFELVGCVFRSFFSTHMCWLIQLLGIRCHSSNLIRNSNYSAEGDCDISTNNGGLIWDEVVFIALIFQLRFYSSHYFQHFIEEIRAQKMLACRGAVMIEEEHSKRVNKRVKEQEKAMCVIETRMRRITEQRSERGNFRQTTNHYKVIRSANAADLEYDLHRDLHDRKSCETCNSSTNITDTRDKRRNAQTSDTIGIIQALTLAANAAGSYRKSKQKYSVPADVSSIQKQGSSGSPTTVDTILDYDTSRDTTRAVASSGHSLAAGGGHGSDIADNQRTIQEQQTDLLTDTADGAADEKPDASSTNMLSDVMRQIVLTVRAALVFCLNFLINLLLIIVTHLDKVSHDYQLVARRLTHEKTELKKLWRLNRLAETAGSQAATSDSLGSLPSAGRIVDEYRLLEQRVRRGASAEIKLTDELDESTLPALFTDTCTQNWLLVCRRLCVCLWYFVLSQTELLVYLFVCINQINSASVLSLPLPAMVFFWGSLSVPRPTKRFWVTLIFYVQIVIIIKYIFQFELFSWNQRAQSDFPFWPPKIIGVEQQEGYAFYDFMLLLVLFFNRLVLKTHGLWNNCSSQELGPSRANMQQELEEKMADTQWSASSRRVSYVVSAHSSPTSAHSGSTLHQQAGGVAGVSTTQLVVSHSQTSFGLHLQRSKHQLSTWMSEIIPSIKSFIYQLTNPESKLRDDVYAYMFLCDFFNIFVVFLGFSSFGPPQGDGEGLSSVMEDNQVPIPFLIILVLNFLLILIDRGIYLRKSVRWKLFFQYLLIVVIHVWLFFILPALTERPFNKNLAPRLWYIVKCLYLVLSAYQIRSGYPSRVMGKWLMSGFTIFHAMSFKIFMLIPFLYELRALMDWLWTRTSLDLFNWLKLEDIYAKIFLIKCTRTREASERYVSGEPRRRIEKCVLGLGWLSVFIIIIFAPLVLFALSNAVGHANPPVDVTMQLSIGSYEPLIKIVTAANDISPITDNDWEEINYYYRKDSKAVGFLFDFDSNDVRFIRLSGNSTSLWTISPPSKEKLMRQVQGNGSVSITLTWHVKRVSNSQGVAADSRGSHVLALPPRADNNQRMNELRDRLVSMLVKNFSNTIQVLLPNVFPKFLSVTNQGKAKMPYALNSQQSPGHSYGAMRDLSLSFVRDQQTGSNWWQMKEDCSDNKFTWFSASSCNILLIVCFSQRAFPSTLAFFTGAGIIGLYTTFVLVIGRLCRPSFADVSSQIMFDDLPYVDRVLQICEDIYLVRERGNLLLEEELFAKILFLYRSPELLIKYTEPPDSANSGPPSDL